MSQGYKDMMDQVLAERNARTEKMREELAQRQSHEHSLLERVNLAPAAALVDSLTGSNLSQASRGPTPFQRDQAMIETLKNAINKQQDADGDAALAFFKNKAYMDQVADNAARTNEERKFNRWLKTQQLGVTKDRLGLAKEKYEADKNKKPSFTADQTNAATFGKRALQAESIFNNLENSGYDRTNRSQSLSESLLPTEFQSENLRKQSQAERNFINAILRRESGAAIADTEFDSAEAQYFPRPGDTPDIIAQKRANRMQAIEGLRVGAAGAWDAVKYIDPLNPDLAPDRAVVKDPQTGETFEIPIDDVNDALSEGMERVK